MTDFDALPSPVWARIDTEQLAQNIRLLERVTDRPVLASVKANAYGHGYEIAARAFLKGGASYLGVARLAEGILLRRAGIDAPILIIGPLLPEEMPLATEAHLEFFVWNKDHLAALHAGARVHLKVDTGLGRLGCLPEEACALAQKIAALNGVTFQCLATHFADADSTDTTCTQKQHQLFEEVRIALHDHNLRPPLIHAANSAATLYHAPTRYDLVRVGLAAYGVAPRSATSLPEGIRPALTWKTRLAAYKTLPAGHGVSYGGTYVTPTSQKIALLPVGYGDGYRRVNGNKVLISGQERAILGRVCMDMCVVDAEGLEEGADHEAVLLGNQGPCAITAHTLAQRWGTAPYEVLTGIAARVPRQTL